MSRECVICGKPFEAVRHQARYCGPNCRKRAQRGAAGVQKLPKVPAAAVENAGLVDSVTAELVSVGRLNTALGQAALALATRMETSTVDTGAGLASMSRELRAVMAQAMGGAAAGADPIDELRTRRDRKNRAG